MTKVKAPLFSPSAHGTLGDVITYRMSKDGPIVEKIPIPRYRRTEAQDNQRVLFAEGASLWHGLSAAEKEAYEVAGDKMRMTGYNRFMKDYLLGVYKVPSVPLFEDYTILASPNTHNKHAFMLGGSRYIFEHKGTFVSDYIKIYSADDSWEKGALLSTSPWKTGDCYLPVNQYNGDYAVIESVVPGKLLWCGANSETYGKGWVGTYKPSTQEWERGIVPSDKDWQWVNFLLYNANDGYFYITGFPDPNIIARCLPCDLTDGSKWEWDSLPIFPYAADGYLAINVFGGDMYIYRQASLETLSWDIVKGTWGAWSIVKTNPSAVPHPYWAWWANLACSGERLYAVFLEKPGADYLWRLKWSTDGINWTTIVTELMMPLTPPDIIYGKEPCCFTFVVRKNPTILGLCNVTTNGTLHFYDLEANLLGGGITYGCTLGYLRDNGLGVFSHQYSSLPVKEAPYCANLVTVTVGVE